MRPNFLFSPSSLYYRFSCHRLSNREIISISFPEFETCRVADSPWPSGTMSSVRQNFPTFLCRDTGDQTIGFWRQMDVSYTRRANLTNSVWTFNFSRLLWKQQPVTQLYPKPDESNYIPFKFNLNINLPTTFNLPKMACSLLVSLLISVYIFHLLHATYFFHLIFLDFFTITVTCLWRLQIMNPSLRIVLLFSGHLISYNFV